LKGSYYDQDQDSVGLPLVQQWDPFINFSDSSDFPYVNSRESIRWAGTLTAPATGTYRFLARTDEFAKVIIDGKEVAPWMRGGSTGSALLTAGSHRMEVFFQKILGPSLTLCWMPPGTKDMEVIPNHCFGYTD
jgi:beta-glucosidase